MKYCHVRNGVIYNITDTKVTHENEDTTLVDLPTKGEEITENSKVPYIEVTILNGMIHNDNGGTSCIDITKKIPLTHLIEVGDGYSEDGRFLLYDKDFGEEDFYKKHVSNCQNKKTKPFYLDTSYFSENVQYQVVLKVNPTSEPYSYERNDAGEKVVQYGLLKSNGWLLIGTFPRSFTTEKQEGDPITAGTTIYVIDNHAYTTTSSFENKYCISSSIIGHLTTLKSYEESKTINGDFYSLKDGEGLGKVYLSEADCALFHPTLKTGSYAFTVRLHNCGEHIEYGNQDTTDAIYLRKLLAEYFAKNNTNSNLKLQQEVTTVEGIYWTLKCYKGDTPPYNVN